MKTRPPHARLKTKIFQNAHFEVIRVNKIYREYTQIFKIFLEDGTKQNCVLL